ncbi:MAG: beta-galactosidase [Lachnospiraceae bacterium]|nr:beta-galactosidase [Lachnospiraceae bacterium]
MKTDRIYFGCAYYDEYMPVDRIGQDFDLMEKAGMNVVRVGDANWATIEPRDGSFDFAHLHRELSAAAIREIRVIVCVPTCVIPSWLAMKYPSIRANARGGKTPSGRIFVNDLTHPGFLRHAERMIRRLMDEVKNYPNVIGFQADSQTRMGEAYSEETQALFIRKMKEHYPDLKKFCREFGLDHWSGRIDTWDDFPDLRTVTGGSLHAAYQRFLRDCAGAFLAWECSILREYMKPDQFITHNFAMTLPGGFTAIDPEVEQEEAAAPLDIAGIDLMHGMQNRFDAHSSAFAGTLARSMKRSPYLVLGAQAQGFPSDLPYEGQLRLAAFTQLSCGANGILYENWHSPHNGPEAYRRGILGHDLTPNAAYREIADFGKEIRPVEPHLLNLKKHPDVAILADHSSLTGLEEHPVSESLSYNRIFREYFDACHELNLECDILWPEDQLTSGSYKFLIVPALYSASEELIEKLKQYILPGGTMLLTYRSCTADEEQKIYHDAAPHKMTDCLGASVENFTIPDGEHLVFTDLFTKKLPAQKGEGKRPKIKAEDHPVTGWMELIKAGAKTEVLATYEPSRFGEYAAVVHHKYGDGHIIYQGCHMEAESLKLLIRRLLAEDMAGIPLPEYNYPLAAHTGVNDFGRTVRYFLNCSGETITFTYRGEKGRILITSGYQDRENVTEESFEKINSGAELFLAPWDLIVIEEDK